MTAPTTSPTISTLTCLWAKLSRGNTPPQGYHPLICHLLDVGSVAEAMWRDTVSPWTKRRITATLGLPDEDTAGKWIAFIAATHDIGKACPPFQHRQETPQELRLLLNAARLTDAKTPIGAPVSHGAVSERALQDDLHDLFCLPHAVAEKLATSVGGHHGRFHGQSVVSDFGPSTLGAGEWTAARHTLLRDLATRYNIPDAAVPRRADNAAAMWLAGLVSTADWIGSNTDYYTFAVPDLRAHGGTLPPLDLDDYHRRAREIAATALDALGWRGNMVASAGLAPLSFAALFPDASPPAPVQIQVEKYADHADKAADGPTLAVIEAPMGEGKTEAALFLADRWSATRGQAGAYIGLPSQATSNQMFGRVRDYLRRRYGDADDAVTLQLLHGHAALSAEFALLLDSARPFVPTNIDDDGDKDDATHKERPSVVAAEWFTHKKRGLLAPYGVGTVDQALMAVLSSKHVFVRLFGLGGKTVVIDEVHAYDTYMSVLLERLLAWLGALGCSVILLSATLPAGRRADLVRAFIGGATGTPPEARPTSDDAPYPRVTWVTTGKDNAPGALPVAHVASHHAPVSERGKKSLRIVQLPTDDCAVPPAPGVPFAMGERLRKALAAGGCAAVICNTVRRAQEMHRALEQAFAGHDDAPDLALLHARMPFDMREAREKEALLRFGKQGSEVEIDGVTRTVRRPRRAVLVSTQIIEQSLDLDFDLMVSDLAPIDLLLQRSGRLHRHKRARPAGLERPTLWLCSPELDGADIPRFAHWKKSLIYDNHVLLRSWLQVRDRTEIDVPGDVEGLIEAVYGDAPCPTSLAPEWHDAWNKTRESLHKETEGDTYQGDIRVIGHPHEKMALDKLARRLRQEDAPELHPAAQAVTRLALPSIGLICLYGAPDHPTLDRAGTRPYNTRRVPNIDMIAGLLRRSVKVTHFGLVKALGDPDAPGMKAYMPVGWGTSALLRSYRMVVFDAKGDGMAGDIPLRLDEKLGLLIGPDTQLHAPVDKEDGE